MIPLETDKCAMRNHRHTSSGSFWENEEKCRREDRKLKRRIEKDAVPAK